MNSEESFLILNILDDASMWFELEALGFALVVLVEDYLLIVMAEYWVMRWLK